MKFFGKQLDMAERPRIATRKKEVIELKVDPDKPAIHWVKTLETNESFFRGKALSVASAAFNEELEQVIHEKVLPICTKCCYDKSVSYPNKWTEDFIEAKYVFDEKGFRSKPEYRMRLKEKVLRNKQNKTIKVETDEGLIVERRYVKESFDLDFKCGKGHGLTITVWFFKTGSGRELIRMNQNYDNDEFPDSQQIQELVGQCLNDFCNLAQIN